MNKKVILILLAMIVMIGGYAGWRYWQHQKAEEFSSRADRALKEGDYKAARVYSQKYLAIKPNDSGMLLLYSEAVFKDESLDPEYRVTESLAALQRIPDSAESGLAARRHEASIWFFDRLNPRRAEECLRRAIGISSDDSASYRSLMQIYCCTGRESLTAPFFESLLQAADGKSETVAALRDWFLSQFATGTYNSGIDQRLQVDLLYTQNIPISQKRLLAFRDACPNDPLPKIALAYWFYLRDDGKQAKLLLDQIDPETLDLSDPLYLTTAVNVYLEMGEIDLATELHENWPGKDYFEYWRQKGVLAQDYQNDIHAAIEAFKSALTVWPGAVDPSIYFRLETCLKSVGDNANAEKYRILGQKIRNITSVERIRELQTILLTDDLSDQNCQRFVEFYSALNREKEVQYWKAIPTMPDKNSIGDSTN